MENRIDNFMVENVNGSVFQRRYPIKDNEICIANDRSIRSVSGTLPSGLRSFKIIGCDNLERVAIEAPYPVQFFSIHKCARLTELTGEIRATKYVSIRECPVLQRLPQLPDWFESLFIMDLLALDKLPEMPSSLVHFTLSNCPQLKNIPKLNNTQHLWINNLPVKALPKLPPTLKTLELMNLPNLTRLPKMPADLQSIKVRNCSGLASLPSQPASLKWFEVQSCPLLKRLPMIPSSIDHIYIHEWPQLRNLMEWLIEVNPRKLDRNSCEIHIWTEILSRYGIGRCIRKGGAEVVRRIIFGDFNSRFRTEPLKAQFTEERICYEQWRSKVAEVQNDIKASSAAIAELGKTHEFARWRVAEKCGWANSLTGQCKDGEPISAYPDNVELSDLEVEKAIAKFLAIHRQLKSAKDDLRKHSKKLARILRKPVKSPGMSVRVEPLMLAFSKSGELMQVWKDGYERPASQTVKVQRWQEIDFLHNVGHAEFKIDKIADSTLFLEYQDTQQRGEDAVERYEVVNHGNTFQLHVDVYIDCGKVRKVIPFEITDTP
jgi:hypothetical protein